MFASTSTIRVLMLGCTSFIEIIFSLSPFICYSVTIHHWSLSHPNSLHNFPVICVITVGVVFTDMVIRMMIFHMCESKLTSSKASFVAPLVLFHIYILFGDQHIFQESIILYGYSFFGMIFMSCKYFTICNDIAHILDIHVFRTYSYNKVLSKDGVRCSQTFECHALI